MTILRSIIDLRRLLLFALIGAPLLGLAVYLLRPTGGGVSESGQPIRDAVLIEQAASGGLKVAAEEGALAPDFEASELNGDRFRLSDFRGRGVVLNFWATWCVSCLAEIPELQRVQDEHADQGLIVVGVNVGEGVGRAQRFLRKELGARYRSFMDPDMTVARRYRAPGLPVTVFIDRQGVIRRYISGQLNYEIFDRFARVALGEEDVPGLDEPLPLRFISPFPKSNGGATATPR